MRLKITTPVPDHNGAVGNVVITQGVGYADSEAHAAEVAYCRANGYTVEPAEDVEPVESDETEEPDEIPMPPRNGSTEAWRAYAVANGLTEAEAAEYTRDQLVELLTTTEDHP